MGYIYIFCRWYYIHTVYIIAALFLSVSRSPSPANICPSSFHTVLFFISFFFYTRYIKAARLTNFNERCAYSVVRRATLPKNHPGVVIYTIEIQRCSRAASFLFPRSLGPFSRGYTALDIPSERRGPLRGFAQSSKYERKYSHTVSVFERRGGDENCKVHSRARVSVGNPPLVSRTRNFRYTRRIGVGERETLKILSRSGNSSFEISAVNFTSPRRNPGCPRESYSAGPPLCTASHSPLRLLLRVAGRCVRSLAGRPASCTPFDTALTKILREFFFSRDKRGFSNGS